MNSTTAQDRRTIQANNAALLAHAFVGLAFSSLLFGAYRSGGLLCTSGGGCDAVRASTYSSLAGVSVPLIGVVFFLGLLASCAFPRLRLARLPFAAMGALGGVMFITLQVAVIGAVCRLCLVVDLTSIGAGVVAWIARDEPTPELTLRRGSLLSLLAAATLALVGLGDWLAPPGSSVVSQSPSQIPREVTRAQQAEGSITIVEFIDFECPACRWQHQIFKQVLAEFEPDVRVAYLHSPLPMHPHAQDAARAYICVENMGIAAQMADKLLTRDELSLPAIEQIAQELALDLAELRRCMYSQETTARLERDQKLADELQVNSLPIFWIGRQKFIGGFDRERVRQALELWVSERGPSGVSPGGN